MRGWGRVALRCIARGGIVGNSPALMSLAPGLRLTSWQAKGEWPNGGSEDCKSAAEVKSCTNLDKLMITNDWNLKINIHFGLCAHCKNQGCVSNSRSYSRLTLAKCLLSDILYWCYEHVQSHSVHLHFCALIIPPETHSNTHHTHTQALIFRHFMWFRLNTSFYKQSLLVSLYAFSFFLSPL